jgi:hypothetical protein
MIYACIRILRKQPALIIVMAGVWLAASAVLFHAYVDGYLWSVTAPLSGVDALLWDFYRMPFSQVLVGMSFHLGWGTAFLGLLLMLYRERRERKKARKRDQP